VPVPEAARAPRIARVGCPPSECCGERAVSRVLDGGGLACPSSPVVRRCADGRRKCMKVRVETRRQRPKARPAADYRRRTDADLGVRRRQDGPPQPGRASAPTRRLPTEPESGAGHDDASQRTGELRSHGTAPVYSSSRARSSFAPSQMHLREVVRSCAVDPRGAMLGLRDAADAGCTALLVDHYVRRVIEVADTVPNRRRGQRALTGSAGAGFRPSANPRCSTLVRR
jgi:hypothetical protein